MLGGNYAAAAVEQGSGDVDLTVAEYAIHFRADLAAIKFFNAVHGVGRTVIKLLQRWLQDVLVLLQILVQMIKLIINPLQRYLNLLIKLRSGRMLLILGHLLIIDHFEMVGSHLRIIIRSSFIVHIDLGEHAGLVVLRQRGPLNRHVSTVSLWKFDGRLPRINRMIVEADGAQLRQIVKWLRRPLVRVVLLVLRLVLLTSQGIGAHAHTHFVTVRHIIIRIILLKLLYCLLLLVTSFLRVWQLL